MSTKNSSYFIPLIIIIAVALIGAGIIIFSKNSTPDTGNPEGIGSGDHIRGDVSALVIIVEFSDFQCPFCSKFHQTMQQVMNDYPDQVKWVYKHFPLDFHKEAKPAAEASECAAEQGKFWEFTDGLFENQSRLGSNLYQEVAGNIGLNLEQFNQCVSSRKYKDKVEADYQEGASRGVRGTPASFINGEFVSGAQPYEKIKEIIENLL